MKDDEASRLLLHFSQLPRILEPRRQNWTDFEVITPSAQLAEEIKSTYPLIGAVHLSEDVSLPALLAVAKERSLPNLLLPETSTATAAHILASVCKGRGEWIRWDGAIKRDCEGVVVGSPLRDISEREVELYGKEMSGQYLFSASVKEEDTEVPTNIDALTAAFLSRLDQENPGTANVVLRTVDKIESVRLGEQELKRQPCRRCLVPAGVELCYSCQKDMKE